ncbi:MAG: PHP domain-containing protein [Leptolyngbyaceae cyanobacterium bins.59]|nr:PHP domain-containing protein [Leptolyngbyaceae cyanobacterium bins.59]
MAVHCAQAASAKSAAQAVTALKNVFQTLHADSCPYSYNFHMHTVCSDGQLPPKELVEQAVAIGLKGFAITDHHTIRGYQIAQEWLNSWQVSHPHEVAPDLWTGVEINADLLGVEVHILAYAFDPDYRGLEGYLQGRTVTGDAYRAERVIEAIHQAGGLAVLAHPARYRRSPDDLIPEAAHLGIDGVETYYAYNNPTPWKTSPRQTEEVATLGMQYQLLNTCGTDTHGRSLLQRL